MIEKLPALHSKRSIALAFALLLISVFFLPYLVPVEPSVSLSYLVGYNNRTAFLLFAIGSVLFSFLVRECLPEAEQANQRLGLLSLFLALSVTTFCCAYRLLPLSQHHNHYGTESYYAINRVQMLASGHKPYLDFEYAYGPAHLYMPVLFAHIAQVSMVRGYYLWWTVQWLAGTAMLWAAIKLLAMPLPRRRLLFCLLFVIQLPSVIAEGTAYTPTRTFGSAFFVVFVAYLWNRFRNPILTASVAIICAAAALSISPEQGIAIYAGLLLWFALLAPSKHIPFTFTATGIYILGATCILFLCWRLGEFSTLIAFGKGAYSFPLLPSPTNIVILISYVIAACMAIHFLLANQLDSVIIPLFLAGFALLPAAMGRCDVGHLLIAAPALLLGVATIEARSALRIWWSPLAILFLVIPILVSPFYLQFRKHQQRARSGQPGTTAASQTDPAVFATTPCKVIYRSLNVVPRPAETPAQDCLDTGYHYTTVNALTPPGVEIMVHNLDRRPLHPVVLFDVPLADQLQVIDDDLRTLHTLEFSPWLPPSRNPPFTYQKLHEYIEQNYAPAPTPIDGFRIWYPKESGGQ